MFTGLESPTHLIIVLLHFGSKRIPEFAKGLGAGLHEFRKGAEGEGDEDTDERYG
jgi:sec-independent protein translocase protein TatA